MPSKRWLSILEILSLDKTKRYLPEIGFSLPMLPTLQAFIRYYHEVDGFKESLEDEQKIRQNFSRELTKYFGDEYYKLIYDLVYRWSFDFDIENWQIIIFLSTRRDLEFYLTAFEDKFDFIGNTILDKRKQMLRKKKDGSGLLIALTKVIGICIYKTCTNSILILCQNVIPLPVFR